MTNVVRIPQPVDEGRLPPQAIDAEMAVLGALLYQPDALDFVADKLPPAAFYLKAHEIIYRAALALAQQDKPCDLMQVANLLHSTGQLEKVGGRSALAALIDCVVSAASIDLHADLILEKWKRRRIGELGLKLVQLQHDPSEWTAIYERAEADLFGLATEQSGKGLQMLEDIMLSVFDESEARSQQRTLPGVSTGFHEIDSMTCGGFQPGDLVICAGRPSMGKTAWSLQVSRHIAATTGQPVAVFSLEMSGKQLAYRLWSAECSIESSRLKAGRLQGQWDQAQFGVQRLAELPIAIDDAFQPSFSHMRTQCRKLMGRKGQMGLVFVDYLQLMDGNGGGNRVQELSGLTRALKGLARELNCPVLVLSQLSRGVESRTNKRPMMSDLRDSGAIEQDADLVLMLYREEYYDPETPDKGVAEVLITKNRNGPTGTVKLLFEPQFTRFVNAATENRRAS